MRGLEFLERRLGVERRDAARMVAVARVRRRHPLAAREADVRER